MFSSLVGEKVCVIVSSRGDNLLEYVGILSSESEDSIVMIDVDVSYLMLNIQKGIFGGNINKYKEGLRKVVINKRYIISCNE